MNIYIASDHGGFELKNRLLNELEIQEPILDVGPFELDPEDDYPDFAEKVALKVANDEGSLGILICRSGNGMCIAANKIKGAYAAVCFSVRHAEMARKDDNANILCLDSDYEGENPVEVAKMFISTAFLGMDTRHGRRFEKISLLEEKTMKTSSC